MLLHFSRMTKMEENIKNEQQYEATETLIYCSVEYKLVPLIGKSLVSSKSL